MRRVIQGRTVVRGQAAGEALVSDEPLSFWGGYDHRTGEITDRRHPLSGAVASGRVLALPFSRGSSTTTAVLLEAVRAGTAPAALVTTGVDSFFALASIVADEMYARPLPVVAVSPEQFGTLRTGDWIEISEDGQIVISRRHGESMDGLTLTVEKCIRTTAEKAYDAFTQPEHLARWFTTSAEGDVRVGGRYSNADQDKGEFLRVERPHAVCFTWENEAHCPGTVVDIRFVSQETGAVRVRLEHSGIADQAGYWDMQRGWSWALDSLKSYLETGQGLPYEIWEQQRSEF